MISEPVREEGIHPTAPWLDWGLAGAALVVGLSVALCAQWAAVFGHASLDWVAGAVLWLGVGLATAYVFAPSGLAVSLFLLFMVASHFSRPFAVLPLGGVEWRPVEMALAFLLMHGAVRWMRGHARFHFDPIHYGLYLVAVFYLYAAVRGYWAGNSPALIVGECRYAIFLAAYPVFVMAMPTARSLRYPLLMILALTVLIAVLSLAFFAYAQISGNFTGTQNALGEFVERQVGTFHFQSVRANGHVFIEIVFVVLTARFFGARLSTRQRFVHGSLMLLLALAILITAMRTAYLAVFVSLMALALLRAPRRIQYLSAMLGLTGLVVAVVLAGLLYSGAFASWFPALGASLKGRFVELEGGLGLFAAHPLLGTGLGSTFEAMGYVSKTTQFSVAPATYQMVHNVWLYYLYKGGLIGMGFVLIGLGGITVRAHYIAERMPLPDDRVLMRGLWAAFVGQLAASLTMPRLVYPIGLVLVCLFGCVFVAVARTGGIIASDGGENSPKMPLQG